MKKILLFLLCFAMLLSLGACGEPSDPSDGTGSDSAVQKTDGKTTASKPAKTDTEDVSAPSDTEEEKPETGYDPSMEHKFIATDITRHSIVVYDLNPCDGDFKKLTDDELCVVWEWDADDDPNCKIKPNAGIDAAKIRYSPYYERDVMIACSSNGWAGVIDYEAKSLLWEYRIGSGPHSIEMLPNGDVVVGCSSDPGALVYVPLSAGITKPVSSIPSLYCHGVSWDPQNELLWVLENYGVYAAIILDEGTENGKLVRIGKSGDVFDNGEGGGHAFSPIYGQPGKYWASSGSKLWIFDAETEELDFRFDRNPYLSLKNIKGIASFPDGTVVQTVGGLCGNDTYGWSSDGLRITIRYVDENGDLRDRVTKVSFDPFHREFYKVQPFTKDYQ